MAVRIAFEIEKGKRKAGRKSARNEKGKREGRETEKRTDPCEYIYIYIIFSVDDSFCYEQLGVVL